MKQKSFLRSAAEILGLALGAALVLAVLCSLYTVFALQWAESRGVYASPQEGATARAYEGYCGVERVEITHASTNSFDGSNPHVWYVMFTVYARSRPPCDKVTAANALHNGTYESGGSFYLNSKKGWVYMPEGWFPGLIGFWMRVWGMEGSG